MDYGIKCPKCNSVRSEVVDSRAVQVGVRRRRECLDCRERYTTSEIVRERFSEVAFNYTELQQMVQQMDLMKVRIAELSAQMFDGKAPKMEAEKKMAKCHPDKRLVAKGLCGTCYARQRFEIKSKRVA